MLTNNTLLVYVTLIIVFVQKKKNIYIYFVLNYEI